MKIQVTALSSFMHGRVHMQAGQTGEFTKGDADDLIKAGLVQAADGGAQAEQPANDAQVVSTPTAVDTETGAETGAEDDDVLGEKAAAPVENKMDPAPANKQRTKK